MKKQLGALPLLSFSVFMGEISKNGVGGKNWKTGETGETAIPIPGKGGCFLTLTGLCALCPLSLSSLFSLTSLVSLYGLPVFTPHPIFEKWHRKLTEKMKNCNN